MSAPSDPRNYGRSKCRSCEAAILWAVTTKGSLMPVDADPHPDGTLVLIDNHGELFVRHPSPMFDADKPLHRSHFATCPDAKEHRKR
jgi:hypothetical protein